MSKSLIIAEKNSMLNDIADCIGGMTKKQVKKNLSYYENNKYVGVALSGHIMELYDIKDYENDKDLKWKDIDLPYFPKEWKLKTKGVTTKGFPSGKEKYDLIKSLIKRDDIDIIINSGDPDAEGEVLVNEVIYKIFKELKMEKTVKRIWIEDHTPKTVLRELNNPRPIKETAGFYRQGIARSHSDWINGINATILISLKTGELYNTGRIKVPLTKQVYDRDMEIENFIKEKYFDVEGIINKDGQDVKLEFKNLKSKSQDEANEKIKNLLNSKIEVVNIEQKEQIKNPKKLFSLATLQKFIFNKYKIKIDDTLKIVQSLYEKKYLTYPRTNSEYMTENEKDKAKDIIKALNKSGYNGIAFKDTKTIFDNSKIDSHSAITPTEIIPVLASLDEDQKKVYLTVLNRFLSNFCEEKCILNNTIVSFKIKNSDLETTLKGISIKQTGFLRFENDLTEKDIPNFKKGEIFDVDFKVVEKETTPPPKMTQASLIDFCLKPFKKENENLSEDEDDKNDDEEYKQILKGVVLGTEATRANAIKEIIQIGYIKEEKNNLSITDKGKNFIEILQKLNLNLWKEASVELSVMLNKVKRGEITIEEIEEDSKKKMKDMVEAAKNVTIQKTNNFPSSTKKEIKGVGICPVCSSKVCEINGKYGKYYACNNKNCNFKISSKIAGKSLNLTIIKNLLKNKETDKIDGFKSKAGKDFSCKLILKEDGSVGFKFD